GDVRNEGARVPYDSQTNQVAEMYAVELAHRKTPPHAPMHIVSDSKYVVDGLTKHLPLWERQGWLGVANADVIRNLVGLLRTRSAPTTFKWVKGHARVHGNEEADRLAGQGANLARPHLPMYPPAPERYIVRGASMLYLTQKAAYLGIRRWNGLPPRPSTERNVHEICRSMLRDTGAEPTESAIWTLLRKDPVSRKARDFIWRAIHKGLRVGSFWSNIPGYEARARCPGCQTTESMQHILCECVLPGQDTAWAMARGLLEKKGVKLPRITLGIALGAHTYSVRNNLNEPLHGPTRLARLILTETAYLIWVLRCERVVGDRAPLQDRLERRYVEQRWMQVVAKRFSLDRALTSKRTAGKQAIPAPTVIATWSGTLQDEQALPNDWILTPEVLVGKPLCLYDADPG
ncbi:RnaseH-domain-containing protein, partial [Trametes versicolor FP-101664 SS1]|uniref:RnaseH-domain-containing protein n=1 Tax=Trametes versicolor (strain FP-101664) TaxID=717944 RepID=UPI000462241D